MEKVSSILIGTYRPSIPEREHALLRVDRGMVYKDAEHHRIELRDQIGLAGQSLEVFPKHSLSAFSLVDLGFQLTVALLQ